ncbi:hypothetical protein BH09GEM1_BH09GEM1_26700 [soil metagenome]
MNRRNHQLTQATLTLLLVVCASCSATDLLGAPSTQSWVMIDNQNYLGRITTTYLVVDKGGAISQGGGPYVQDVTASCSFSVPLSGNWAGTAVHITSTGGSCGAGYILTMDGIANGSYGSADAASGTYRISYSGKFSGVDTGTWRATLSH